MLDIKRTSFICLSLVLSAVVSPAQNDAQLSLVEAVDRAVRVNLQLAQVREALNSAQTQYTIAELETRLKYSLNGPFVSYRLDKRFNEPTSDYSYPPRDTDWSGSFGLGISREMPSGARLDLAVDNTLSVSRYGNEQLAQVPRLSVSYSLPLIVGEQLGSSTSAGINLVLAENGIKHAQLREREMLNRIASMTVRAYLELELLLMRIQLAEGKIGLYSRYAETAEPGVAILYESSLISLEANLIYSRIWAQRLFAELATLVGIPEQEADSLTVKGLGSVSHARLIVDTGAVGDAFAIVQAGLYLENVKLYASRQDLWKLPSVSFSGSVEPRYGSTRESDMNFLRSITDYSEPGSGFYVNAGINFRIPLGSAAEKSALSDRDQSRIASAELGLQEVTEKVRAELSALKTEKESLVQRVMILHRILSVEEKIVSDPTANIAISQGDRNKLRMAEYDMERHYLILQLVYNRMRILELSGADLREEILYLFGE